MGRGNLVSLGYFCHLQVCARLFSLKVALDNQAKFDSTTAQAANVVSFFTNLAMQDVECIEIEAVSTMNEPVTLIIDTISFCYEFCKYFFF